MPRRGPEEPRNPKVRLGVPRPSRRPAARGRGNTREFWGYALWAVADQASDSSDDAEIANQLQRVIRRVKQSMNYRGSYSTRDILGSLVARWVQSGEWERLKELPAEERKLGHSVRRFILDRLAQLRRRGPQDELDADKLAIPDEEALAEMVALAQLRQWILARVADLEAGVVDDRVKIPLANPPQVGLILRLHLDGKTQREIATATGVSLGAANKRIAEGTSYLVLLQSIESGLVTS